MRSEIPNPGLSRFRGERISALIPVGLLVVGLPWGIWSVYALLGGGGSQSVEFDVAGGWFALLAAGYLGLHGLRGMAWTSVPALLTFEGLVGFVVIPAWRFASGDDVLDSTYVHAIILALLGFIAFWIASLILIKESSFQFSPRHKDTPDRIAFMSVSMLGLGVVGNLILWKAGLYGYTSDMGVRASSLGFIQWLSFLASLLGAALVVSAIEVIGKRSAGGVIGIVFWLSLLSSIGFGVIAGMKSSMLFPLLYVILIYCIIKKRMPRTALLLPLFLIVLVYPFVSAFRVNLNAGYRAQFNTIGGLEATVAQSFEDAFQSFGATTAQAESLNSQDATNRLSYLSYLRDVIGLPAPSMLNGEEKVWLAPIYPLVPRFLWKGKPVLDKGMRLASLLGNPGGGTSAALTPIGDLFAMYGTYGVLIGMFVWGACIQLYMNWIGSRNISERSLFVYTLMLQILLNFESDVVGIVASAVQNVILVVILSYAIYGHRSAPPIIATSRNRIGAQ